MNGLTEPTITYALITGAIWAGICIVFDVFGWVLIKHPWSLSFKEFYVDYQPWITLIYLAIFAGPTVGYIGSCRVLEKAGFQYEGTLRSNALKNGNVFDMKMYSKLKTDL